MSEETRSNDRKLWIVAGAMLGLSILPRLLTLIGADFGNARGALANASSKAIIFLLKV